MEYVKIEGQFPKFSHCAVTLGKFDGIHRGHRKLIQTILNRKKEYGELAVVMAFVSDRQTILTSEERRILLEKMGVDILLECPLNDQIKHMKADRFYPTDTQRGSSGFLSWLWEKISVLVMNARDLRNFWKNMEKNTTMKQL